MMVGMQADSGYTHPPGSIKVALGQGFVIIGIRIREGPLSHDAGNEPAEQGGKNTETETGARLTRGPPSFPQLRYAQLSPRSQGTSSPPKPAQ